MAGARLSESTKKFAVVFALALGLRLIAFAAGIPASQNIGGGDIPYVEDFKDYYYAYVPSVNTFLSGRILYRDFYHAYPPLFIYVLSLFEMLGTWWSAAVPLVLADVLTIIPVHLIARRLFDQNRALLAAVAFVICPVNLFYVDYLWLNPSLTTLFLIISVYLFLCNRTNLSALSLAISTGFKQTSLLAAPIMVLDLFRTGKKREAATFSLIYLVVFLLISLPYIVVEPSRYLWCLRVPFLNPGSPPDDYMTIGFATQPSTVPPFDPSTLSPLSQKWVKIAYGLNSPVTLHLPILILLPFDVSPAVYNTGKSVLLALFGLGYLALLLWLYRKKAPNGSALIKSLSASQVFFFAMYGLYKYYLAGVTPLLVLSVKDWKGLAFFISYSLVFMFTPRLLSPYLLLVALPLIAKYG